MRVNFPVVTAPPEVQAEVRILKRWNEYGNTAHSLPALHQVRKPFQSPLSAEARAGHASGGQPTDRKRDAVGQLKAPGMPHLGPLKIAVDQVPDWQKDVLLIAIMVAWHGGRTLFRRRPFGIWR